MIRHRTLTIEGNRIFFREAGHVDAPTLVLLHGYPSSSHSFRHLIPLLEDRFHLVAPDLLGFGFSEAPAPSRFRYTFHALAEIVDKLLQSLNLQRYSLYMHDYGGPVGLRLATAHPERVRALIFQNANSYMEGVSPAVAELFLPLWKERNAGTEAAARAFMTAEATKGQYLSGTPEPEALGPEGWTLDQALLERSGQDELQLALFCDYQTNVALYDAWHAWFREYRPPALVVWGKNDPFFTVAGAEAYRKDLPEAEVHLLDAGHFAQETHAREIAARIRFFADRVTAAGKEVRP